MTSHVTHDPWSLPTYPERITRALAELQQAVAILTGTDSVSHGCSDKSRENECAPEGAGNTRRDDLHDSIRSNPEGGADLMMVAPTQHENPTPALTADERVVTRLQGTIDRLLRQRAALLAERDLLVKLRAHWFVDDGAGYCLACALPARNARHCERAA